MRGTSATEANTEKLVMSQVFIVRLLAGLETKSSLKWTTNQFHAICRSFQVELGRFFCVSQNHVFPQQGPASGWPTQAQGMASRSFSWTVGICVDGEQNKKGVAAKISSSSLWFNQKLCSKYVEICGNV